jgi:TRAP-type transport system small permease protein
MYRLIESLLKWLIAIVLIGIAVIVSMQVFFRFVLSSPLAWPEELGRLLFVYLVFIGAGLVSVHDDHIAIELVEATVSSSKPKAVLELFRHLAIAVTMAVVVLGGTQLFPRSARLALSATGLPKSLMVLPVIIGGAIMTVEALRRAGLALRLLIFNKPSISAGEE